MKAANDRRLITEKAQAFFEELWRRGDPWQFETSEFERTKYAAEIAILSGRRYPRALEIGCGAGTFTRSLARVADRVIGMDISPTAVERAAALGINGAEFRAANIMDYNLRADGPWDLVVMNETIYYLGWLYPFFDVAWLAGEIFAATREGGRMLMANTCDGVEDYLLRPWIIRTYRDLFLNIGYRLDSEEIFRGKKDGAEIDVMISLFGKAHDGVSANVVAD